MGAREIAKKVADRFEEIRTLKCTIVQKYDNTTETMYSVLKLPNKEYDRFPTGEIYIRNGTKSWDYYNGVWYEYNVTTINKTKMKMKVYNIILNLLNSNNLTFEGVKKYDNRTCYVIRLHNSTENIEMWIDAKLLFPVLIKGYSNGQYGMIEFKNVQINVPLNNSIFLPPKDAKIVHEMPIVIVNNNINYPINPTNIEVLVGKGIELMNSTELSKYLGFTPVIPKGWKVACANLYFDVNNNRHNEIDLLCVNGSKPYRYSLDIIEEPVTRTILEALSANNYTIIDGIKVYTMELDNKTIPIGFSRSGIWYEIAYNESKQMEIVKDLIEHPVTFNYRIPVSVTYEFNRTKNIKPFIEKYFKHKIILPYPYNKTLVKNENSTNTFQVIAYLDEVHVSNRSVTLYYGIVQSWHNISSSWGSTTSLVVNESLKGKIPSDAKKMELGSNTVWVKSGKYYIKVYAKRNGLLLTFGSPVVLSNKYLYKFVEYFLS